MTKKEFAKLLFEKGVFTTRTEAEKKVDIIFDSMEKILLDGENLSIINWGKLEIVERAPRLGRNPKTGEEVISNTGLPLRASKPITVILFPSIDNILQTHIAIGLGLLGERVEKTPFSNVPNGGIDFNTVLSALSPQYKTIILFKSSTPSKASTYSGKISIIDFSSEYFPWLGTFSLLSYILCIMPIFFKFILFLLTKRFFKEFL